MPETRELFDSLVAHAPLDSEMLASLIDALAECEEAVTACATGMLALENVDQFRLPVLHDLDCGDVVAVTRRVLTRAKADDSALMSAQLEACLMACQRSYDTCSPHASHHAHCRICSQATERTVEACRRALEALRS